MLLCKAPRRGEGWGGAQTDDPHPTAFRRSTSPFQGEVRSVSQSADSVRREAVEQPVAAGAAQVGLAAAAVGSARGMRRIPRARRRVVTQSLAIDVPDHRGALRAAGPVTAGAGLSGRKGLAFRRRAGEHVVAVRREADAWNDETSLGE